MAIKIDSEFASLIRPLSGEEYSLLKEAIKTDGLRDPLVVWNGTLVDGHHRLKICQALQIHPHTVAHEFGSRDEAKLWILKNQLARRNLEPFSRAEIAFLMEPLIESRQGQTAIERQKDKTIDPILDRPFYLAADIADLGHATYAKAKAIIQSDREDLKEKLRSPKSGTSINSAYQQVRRPNKPAVIETEFPEGKYRVIYADPPWEYSDKRSGLAAYGPAQKEYPVMGNEAIAQLPIQSLAADDAVLFLWITSPLLPQGIATMSAWGFAYKASFVWDKQAHNWGHYNSVRHEFLLLGTRGSCLPDSKTLIPSIFVEKRRKHSEKPDRAREIIQSLYPHGPRVELFARKQTPGWAVWGSESGE